MFIHYKTGVKANFWFPGAVLETDMFSHPYARINANMWREVIKPLDMTNEQMTAYQDRVRGIEQRFSALMDCRHARS